LIAVLLRQHSLCRSVPNPI